MVGWGKGRLGGGGDSDSGEDEEDELGALWGFWRKSGGDEREVHSWGRGQEGCHRVNYGMGWGGMGWKWGLELEVRVSQVVEGCGMFLFSSRYDMRRENRDELLVSVWYFIDGEIVDFEGGKFPS